MDERESHKKYYSMNKRYFKFKELGLCRCCGADPLPGKIRCKKCHERHLKYQNKNKLKLISLGFCRSCGTKPKLPNKSTCQECFDYNIKKEKLRYQKLREEVIQAYGGHCICCGEDCSKYLQLDHINNDGKEHRLELSGCRKGGMYAWAKRNNFPGTLQLLCANCHQAKTGHGGCTIWDHPPFINKYTIQELEQLISFSPLVISINMDLQYDLFNKIEALKKYLYKLGESGWSNISEERELSLLKDTYEALFCDTRYLPKLINGPLSEVAKLRLQLGK